LRHATRLGYPDLVLHDRYPGQICSIARALEVVGERWTLLIVRDLLLGVRRFDDLQADLGIARNVLTARLEKLLDEGIVERHAYSQRPVRHEYRLTDKGLDLWPTVLALLHWGDRHAAAEGGPPTVLEHRGCGGAVGPHGTCERCGAPLERRDVIARPGPGAGPDHPLRRRGEPVAPGA
jgi:DNA-binding HxlR family transcriptional regulator